MEAVWLSVMGLSLLVGGPAVAVRESKGAKCQEMDGRGRRPTALILSHPVGRHARSADLKITQPKDGRTTPPTRPESASENMKSYFIPGSSERATPQRM